MHADHPDTRDIEAGLAGLVMLDARLEHRHRQGGAGNVEAHRPGYRGLANIIVSQMVSKASAAAVWNRMEASLAEISADACLRPTTKIAGRFGYVPGQGRYAEKGRPLPQLGARSISMPSAMPKRVKQFTNCRRSRHGRWTAEVYLLFCAGHPDVFPAGDVALQNAIGHALGTRTATDGKRGRLASRAAVAMAQCRRAAFLGLLCAGDAPDALPVTP